MQSIRTSVSRSPLHSLTLVAMVLGACMGAVKPRASAQTLGVPLSDPVMIAEPGIVPSVPAFTPEQLQQLQTLLYDGAKQAARPRVTYDKGFLLSVPGETADDESFRMRINSWFQFRHTVFDSNGPNLDQNDFEFERLRLIFAGHVYTPDLMYQIQYDGDSDQSEVSDWVDYFISYDLGHHALGCRKNYFGVKVGKWKLPFNRARDESGWKLQFSDRSIASVFFDINRSLGLAMYGDLPLVRSPIRYEAALFNGFGTGGFRPVRSGELDRNLGFSARLTNEFLGQWGDDGEPDLSFHYRPAIRLGAGIAVTRLDNDDGPREFQQARVVDSGATLDSILPVGVNKYSLLLAAVDANFKYRGMSLLTEYYFRSTFNFAGGNVPDLFDHGFMLQTGYFLVPKTLELLSRWSRIVGDSGTLGATDQSADEIAGGVVWYLRGHNAKLTFDATHLNGAPIRDLALNVLPGDDGMLYRTQLQVRF